MTQTQRKRWEAKTIQKTKEQLRTGLNIIRLMSKSDKDEVEAEVMAEIKRLVANVSDENIERHPSAPDFYSAATCLAMNILHKRDIENSMIVSSFT